jgi:zinc ribbon protein
MLLVFGVRYLYSLVATGTFHCPVCGVDRNYRLRNPRAWFHLFWIPLIPLRRGEPIVECDVCRSRFRPDVLSVPTSEQFGELLSRGVRTAAAYLITAAEAGPDALPRAVEVLQRSLGPAYSRELLEADLAAHRQGSDFSVLGRLAGQLDVLGKEQLLRGLAELELAIADGREPDWSRLGDVAAALGVTPAHLRGIVQEARARSRY